MPAVSFSGLASGIDGDAIIKATLDARRLAQAPLKNKVAQNSTETTALEEFTKKLLAVNDFTKDFRTLAGSAIKRTAVSSNSDAVDAVPGSNAVSGSTTLTVERLAKAGTISLETLFTNLEGPVAPGLTGESELSITVGSGESASVHKITVNSSTTVSEIVTELNKVSEDKYHASLVNLGTTEDPEYRLLINGTQTGTEKGALSISTSADLTALNIFGIFDQSAAQDAQIRINGLGTVNRPTNQITDLLPGVSLSLKQENTGPITITVGNDADKTAQKVNDLVGAFNEVIKFAHENSLIKQVDGEKGSTNEFGTLARTRIDNQAVDAVRSALLGARSGVEGSEVQIAADLGITTARDGTISFDTAVFMEAVSKDPTAVENVLHSFADEVGATGGVIDQYTKFQGLIEQSISTNDEEVKRYNDRITRLEELLERQEQSLKLLFANLEKNIAKLNSSGDAITSLAASTAK